MSLADEFKALADAVTPGRWEIVQNPGITTIVASNEDIADITHGRRQENAAFIAWCGSHRDEIERALRRKKRRKKGRVRDGESANAEVGPTSQESDDGRARREKFWKTLLDDRVPSVLVLMRLKNASRRAADKALRISR